MIAGLAACQRGVVSRAQFVKAGIHGDAIKRRVLRRMLSLIRAAELPAPRVNARIWPSEVDFLWREQRLVVEVDGCAYHANRGAFERDREREAALAATGYAVLRVTWRQLVDAPEAVVA